MVQPSKVVTIPTLPEQVPTVALACSPLVYTARGYSLTLPWGTFSGAWPLLNIPDPMEVVNKTLDDLNVFLTPLSPLLDIADVVVAVANCIIGPVSAAIGPPPNPMAFISELATCAEGLIEKLAKLLNLIPGIRWVAMVVSFFDAILAYLSALLTRIRRLILLVVEITDTLGAATGAGAVALTAVVDCAREDVDIELTSLNESSPVIERLLGLVRFFYDATNTIIRWSDSEWDAETMPTLSDLPVFSDAPLQEDVNNAAELAPVMTLLRTLQQVRALIPISATSGTTA